MSVSTFCILLTYIFFKNSYDVSWYIIGRHAYKNYFSGKYSLVRLTAKQTSIANSTLSETRWCPLFSKRRYSVGFFLLIVMAYINDTVGLSYMYINLALVACIAYISHFITSRINFIDIRHLYVRLTFFFFYRMM